jgi:hypothetical protein
MKKNLDIYLVSIWWFIQGILLCTIPNSISTKMGFVLGIILIIISLLWYTSKNITLSAVLSIIVISYALLSLIASVIIYIMLSARWSLFATIGMPIIPLANIIISIRMYIRLWKRV